MSTTKNTVIVGKNSVSKQKAVNSFKCEFAAKSVNESFGRMIAASFVSQLDPSVGELSDFKTAVSEAVTNCIVHAYRDMPRENAKIYMSGEYYSDGTVILVIKDKGCGIANIEKAMEPLFTTDAANERSGMGFTIMSSFCDKLKVSSAAGKGTTVTIRKRFSCT